MFGSDIGMIERSGFLCRKRQDFLHARRVRNVADRFLVRSCPDLFLDLQPHIFEIEPHFSEHIDRSALSKPDQSQEQVFRPNEVVIEAVGFPARERQHLLCARRKVVQRFGRSVLFARHRHSQCFPK